MRGQCENCGRSIPSDQWCCEDCFGLFDGEKFLDRRDVVISRPLQSGRSAAKRVEGERGSVSDRQGAAGMPSYAELYALAYVPNQWQCPKCGFVLCKKTLSVATGQIGTSETDRQSEPCPNDGEWMVPVTYREVAESHYNRLLEEFEKRDAQRSGDDVPMTPVEKLWVLAPNTAQTETATATPSTQETVLVERLKELKRQLGLYIAALRRQQSQVSPPASEIYKCMAYDLEQMLRTATHPEKTKDES